MMRSRYIYHKGQIVYAQEGDRVLIDKTIFEPKASFYVMPDIQPYKSMIDGSLITSRSRHREHLRDHGCIEVGNDSSIKNPKPQPLKSPPGLKDAIIQAVNAHERRS